MLPSHRLCTARSKGLRIAAVDAWLYICDATASAFALLGLQAARHRIDSVSSMTLWGSGNTAFDMFLL